MQFGGGLGISDPTNGERSPPTTNKYARRGDIVFVGGGAAIVIGLSIFGGLTYFDTFHTSPPKPVAEKPNAASGSAEAITSWPCRETNTCAAFRVAK